MAPGAVPPPPRPDPVTLDHIYNTITSSTASLSEKAYCLVAINTIAFHGPVKLFLYETPQQQQGGEGEDELQRRNRQRRESFVQNVAFFLAQRTTAVCLECRWETVSLLGELCRLEHAYANAPTTPQGMLEAKLNLYARQNLEYLSVLPWFRPCVEGIIGGAASQEDPSGASSSADAKKRLQALRMRQKQGADAGSDGMEEDEDVVIALKDIVRALPTVVKGAKEAGGPVVEWTKEQEEQAVDLMFLDASTTMLQYIPCVSRSMATTCAACGNHCVDPPQSGDAAPNAYLRCSSCKAVYYCSADCQKKHWTTAHRVPCKSYKERCESILEQYYAANRSSGKRQKRKDIANGEVVILEVPLEPTLFFETRRYLYDHRDGSYHNVDFNDYFMKYTAGIVLRAP